MSKPEYKINKNKKLFVILMDSYKSDEINHSEFIDLKRRNKIKFYTQEGWKGWKNEFHKFVEPGQCSNMNI